MYRYGSWFGAIMFFIIGDPSTCTYINYFATVDRDGLGPTESILLSLRRAAVFPVISLLILFAGQTLCLLMQWRHCRPALTTVFGFLYVIGGLCMFVGIIIYIGAITEEAGNQPKSMDDPKFMYRYGPSFALTFTSFVGSELTGVLAVHLYVARRRLRYASRRTTTVSESGETENGTVTDGTGGGDGNGIGEVVTERRNGASLVSKLLAAVFPASSSPTKNSSKSSTVVVAPSIDDRNAAATAVAGGTKQRNRRRRSSLALADQQPLSADGDLFVGGVVSRMESAMSDDEEDLINVLRGASSLPRATANKTRNDAERQQPAQPSSSVSCTRHSDTCNNHGRLTPSYSVATFGHQQQQQQLQQQQHQVQQYHQSQSSATRSVTNSPGTSASFGYRCYTADYTALPGGQHTPSRSVRTRSPPTNWPNSYNTMTSLPPPSASLHDGRLCEMASGVGLIGRAWSIDGFDQGIRRITNV